MGRDIRNGMKHAALGPSVGEIGVNDVVEFSNGFIEGIVGKYDLPLECIIDF